MGFKNNLIDVGDINEVCSRFPIFERSSHYDCCVRVRGTNLLMHFTGGYSCPFWIADQDEWNLEDDFIDMVQYFRGVSGSGCWLEGKIEDTIVRIPNENIRNALINALIDK